MGAAPLLSVAFSNFLAHLGAWIACCLGGMFFLFLVMASFYGRRPAVKPKATCQCGDPACTAFALLNGKWPKYQRPYSEREAMRIARAKREGVA